MNAKSLALSSTVALCLTLTPSASAQSGSANGKTTPHRRAFGVVMNSIATSLNGDWNETQRLRTYIHDNVGTYIVFTSDDSHLYRLDDDRVVRKAQSFYTPLQRAQQDQERLASQQALLAQKQQTLSGPTPVSYEQQHKISVEQQEVGKQQSTLGAKQEVLANAYYEEMRGLLDVALSRGQCKQVD